MWLKAPTNVELLSNEVHIWRENLDNVKPLLKDLTRILAEDELVRARRFHFEQHRQRFIAARGILRNILSRYLNIEPSEIKFGYEARGKPFLEQNLQNKLTFNVSHSQNFALYAVSLDNSIGVDLESISSTTDVVSLAQRFFSPNEFAIIESAPQEQQHQLFFRYWTCKEAYLKATGTGLKDLQQVEISLAIEQSAKLNIPNSDEWSLLEIQPFSNCAGAVAVKGRDLQFKYWDYCS
ncbi:MAG: 4'-phosphopantetheinyl transferase superfamily protein [Cyanobacteria bacterium P01_C01_bin.38]